MKLTTVLVSLAACASVPLPPTTNPDPAREGSCAGAPVVDSAGFRHLTSRAIAALGEPRHRGVDLLAATGDDQRITGIVAYTAADKALEDEDVALFACEAHAWQPLGTARSDDEGRFALAIAEPLPAGTRDLYAVVVGDGTGVGFAAYVAPAASAVIVTDIDGTLTDSENAFIETLAGGEQPDAQPGAAEALAAASALVVYVSARGNQYTEATRRWLASRQFPPGPIRLAGSFLTLPGSDTVAFKTVAIAPVADRFALVAGIGNRATDIAAYAASGIAADRIFIKLPEYTDEVAADLGAGRAVGFADYDELGGRL